MQGPSLRLARAAIAIGELKRQRALPYFVPEREARVIERVLARNGGPLGPEALRAIWREILSASLALEQQTEKLLLTIPEVERVFCRLGTSEVATDPMPPSQNAGSIGSRCCRG